MDVFQTEELHTYIRKVISGYSLDMAWHSMGMDMRHYMVTVIISECITSRCNYVAG